MLSNRGRQAAAVLSCVMTEVSGLFSFHWRCGRGDRPQRTPIQGHWEANLLVLLPLQRQAARVMLWHLR